MKQFTYVQVISSMLSNGAFSTLIQTIDSPDKYFGIDTLIGNHMNQIRRDNSDYKIFFTVLNFMDSEGNMSGEKLV